MDENILDRVKKLHFVGIGGSGMCPMAEILHHKGFQLTGSDINESDTLERIKGYGIPVAMGHKAENIGDAECVVYTAACKADNPELVAAREKGIPTLERSVMLGMLTEKFKRPVAVSGTHGKTTTTAMLTEVLIDGGLDPSAIIGGKLPMLGANSRVGRSETIVVEACEYVDTFLQLHPAVSVILNIDADHLDYFKTVDNIVKSFHQFGEQTSQLVVVNGDNPHAVQAVEDCGRQVFRFSVADPAADGTVAHLTWERGLPTFDILIHGERYAHVSLRVGGGHNVSNALAAACAAWVLGVPGSAVEEGLAAFTGAGRRFEKKGTFHGADVYDDYAHHPDELHALLTMARTLGYRRIVCAFQPHTYSRTAALFDRFVEELKLADVAILAEIYAAREQNTLGISSRDLAERIPGSLYCATLEEVTDRLRALARPGDLLLTVGAGDIFRAGEALLS